jgi:hypothetical protein
MSEGRARASTQKDHAVSSAARTAKATGQNEAAAQTRARPRLRQPLHYIPNDQEFVGSRETLLCSNCGV